MNRLICETCLFDWIGVMKTFGTVFTIVFIAIMFIAKCTALQALLYTLIGSFIWFGIKAAKKQKEKENWDELVDVFGGQEEFDKSVEEGRRHSETLHIPEVMPSEFDVSILSWLGRIQFWCIKDDRMNIEYTDSKGRKSRMSLDEFEKAMITFDGLISDDLSKLFEKWHFQKKSFKSFLVFREFLDSSGTKRKEFYFVELNLDNEPANPYRKAEQNQQQDQTEGIQQKNLDRNPYEVLGISEQATAQEIKAAYKSKAIQNHPDRTAGLGEEYKQLAEKRMKEINAAYEKLRKDNGQA
jgi:hypothetical protein